MSAADAVALFFIVAVFMEMGKCQNSISLKKKTKYVFIDNSTYNELPCSIFSILFQGQNFIIF